MQLHGWEVKSIRAGKANLSDTYVIVRNGEAFLLNSQITPLGIGIDARHSGSNAYPKVTFA